MAKSEKPNARTRRFINEYLVDFNGARAAVRAGIPSAGARVQACLLLKRKDVQAAIEEGLAEHRRRCTIDRQRLRDEIAKIAMCNSTTLIGPKGRFLELNEVCAADRAAIQSIGRTEFGPKYRFHDKTKALHLLALMDGHLESNSGEEKKPRAIVQIPGVRLTVE